MTVLSPIEKLIALRKKYKISQKDLAGDHISRSHLAMIETGKNRLNEHIAQIIVDSFNSILEKRLGYQMDFLILRYFLIPNPPTSI